MSPTDYLNKHGTILKSYGINGYGLTKGPALSYLDWLEFNLVPVLGSDIYSFENEILIPLYENWHCGSNFSENKLDFVTRSIDITRRYITKHNDNHVLFVIVIDD